MTAVLMLRNPRELAELKTQLQQPDARAVLAEKVQPQGLEEPKLALPGASRFSLGTASWKIAHAGRWYKTLAKVEHRE